ncbi:MAG TPA: hypothetical protein ENN35_06445 [Deltaproteobacteria bacterium]|nr:hypothetical protein [Deltaproteobacteria bacterium]
MENKEIREAILKKARDEAARIVDEAKEKGGTVVAQAQERKNQLLEDEKNRIIAEAKREAAKLLAQSTLKERQTILRAKDGVMQEILERARKELERQPMDRNQIEPLLNEALEALVTDGTVRLFVAPKDSEAVREFIQTRDELKEKIVEVKEQDMMGGIIAETADGMISIDNSFERRLAMLIPKILPEIGKKLFGG